VSRCLRSSASTASPRACVYRQPEARVAIRSGRRTRGMVSALEDLDAAIAPEAFFVFARGHLLADARGADGVFREPERDHVSLHREGAAIGEREVVFLGAARVGVPGELDGTDGALLDA